jgi:RNA polymerase sigma-70 factor (ECF subfamily)
MDQLSVLARPEWDWAGLRRRSRDEAMRVLGDPCRDDAAQEAVTRAWRLRDRCRDPHRPEPWVAQIARNEALRLRAGEKKQDDMASRAAEEWISADFPPEERLISRLCVQQALSALTLEERRLIDLRYKDDLAQPAIASILGMPEGTVKVKLHRLRQRLRKVISEEP